MKIKATVNYKFINENFNYYRGLVLPGGTRSTKTISTLQWLIIYAHTHSDKHIVIARDTLKNLKRTVLKDFISLCYGYGYDAHAPNMELNKSDLIAKIGSCTFEFIGLIDDPMRVHGLKSDIFYINEAIGTYKNTFDQLNYRCIEGFILDCNPSEPQHWVYELERREDVKFFRTSYLDNPFLSEAQVKEIESKEPTPENIERGTADEREWSVYGLGLAFKGKEIIYPEWSTYDQEPQGYDYKFFGLDWGYNHPLACVKVIINGKDLYVSEVVYASGMDDLDALGERLLQEPDIKSQYIVCDNTEERSRNHLIKMGLPMHSVKKPPNSVKDGIRKVKQYNIHVHQDSHNLIREINNYKWKVDSRTDSILDVPVKENDDGMDAMRYTVYTYL